MVADAASDAHCVLDAASPLCHDGRRHPGAACAVCLVDNCQVSVRDCETDCLCGYYFACVAYLAGDAGASAFITCAGDPNQTAALASNHVFSQLYACSTTTCKTPCVPATDAGPDAAGGDSTLFSNPGDLDV